MSVYFCFFFFFSSRRRHTRSKRDRSSDVCSSDLQIMACRHAGRQQDEAVERSRRQLLRRRQCHAGPGAVTDQANAAGGVFPPIRDDFLEIGRASCRERGEVVGGGGRWRRKNSEG